MTANGLGSMFTLYDGRRPVPVVAPPARGEIRKLRERLSRYGATERRQLTDAACEFLAAAVVAPGGVRAQLNRPNIRPTRGGHLEVIYATVPIDCLVPDPGNGRVVGATAWPAADASSGQTLKLWAPSDLHVHPNSGCEVLVQGDSLAEFKTLVEDSAERTKQLNPRMREKVQRDGVLDPLLCQLMHVQTADGHAGIALVTRDGSSRCSFAKEAHRAHAHDALFGSVRDLEVRRERWLEMRRRFEAPAEQVSEHELVELRTFLIPVQIIIGFRVDDPGATVLDAVDDIVRRTHVETSYPWMPVAQSNSQADQVLSALNTHGVIDEARFLLYGGKLSRADRSVRGLPIEPDVVLADILQVFGAGQPRQTVDALHTAVRRATGAGRVTPHFKATLAGALGLRQFPADGRIRSNANTTLEEALRLDGLWEQAWDNTDRAPDELGDAALDELRTDGEPGPACRELAAKAAGFLAAQGWLKRQTFGSGGLERDQRAPNMVLDVMHRSEQGVHVLAEALTAGRRDQEARAMAADGTVIEQVSGDPKPLGNDWIRSTFSEALSDLEPTVALIGAETPRERVAAKVREIERAARTLQTALAEAMKINDDSDVPYLSRHGWSPGVTQPTADILRIVASRLDAFGMLSESALTVPTAEQLALSHLEVS